MTPRMIDARKATPGTTAIDALAAPVHDGDLLIFPDAGSLMSSAKSNRALRAAYTFKLLNRPVGEWLRDRTQANAPLVIMSGHQPEFFHPGVWIKHVFGIRLAERLGGRMTFLVVDSDVPGVIRLEWPVVQKNFATIDYARAATVMDWRSYEHIRDRNDIDYGGIFDAAEQRFAGTHASNLNRFAEAMLTSGPDNYVDRWIAGLSAFDASLDVPQVEYTRIGHRFDFTSPHHDGAAAALVAHLIVNAHDFRLAYNSALAAYRSRRDIAGNQHPIPDLAETERRIECPFWLTHAEHGRERLYATPCRIADCVTIFAGDKPLAEIPTKDLIASPSAALAKAIGDWRIRPRALAQTLYARLFACDLFIHGIGGAKYDQVTDDLVRRFFDAESPAYGTVSATCRLDLPTFDATPEELAASQHGLRDMAYNPQRYLTTEPLDDVRDDLDDRDSAIAESDRLRETDPSNRPARKAAFDRIHDANRRILGRLTATAMTMKARVAELSRELSHNQIAANREWFFALYSREQLLSLRDLAWRRVDEAMDSSNSQ